VTLNPAAAVAKVQGPAAAPAFIEPLAGELSGYFFFYGVKGVLLRDLGRVKAQRCL
jgi:RNA polymerase sigma-70 factor (ECF subfamily)